MVMTAVIVGIGKKGNQIARLNKYRPEEKFLPLSSMVHFCTCFVIVDQDLHWTSNLHDFVSCKCLWFAIYYNWSLNKIVEPTSKLVVVTIVVYRVQLCINILLVVGNQCYFSVFANNKQSFYQHFICQCLHTFMSLLSHPAIE